MPLEKELLEILCCPVSHQPLRVADQDVLNHASALSGQPLTEGLIREDGHMVYPIRQGIPLLLPEEGIALP